MTLPLDSNTVGQCSLHIFQCSYWFSPQRISCLWGPDRGVYDHAQKVLITHVPTLQSNVLIYGNGRACLADFGLSTIILEFVGTSYFTSSIRGNVRWVAAELCEVSGDEELKLSAECDIYSFGSIMLQVGDSVLTEICCSLCTCSRY
jgi:serine/threonine protein kinase